MQKSHCEEAVGRRGTPLRFPSCPFNGEIATPVCALVHNDSILILILPLPGLSGAAIYQEEVLQGINFPP